MSSGQFDADGAADVDAGAMATGQPAAADPADTTPSKKRAIILMAVAGGVAILVFGVILPQLVDWDVVFEVLGAVPGWQLAGLVVLGLLRYIPAGWIYSLVLPGLSLWKGIMSWVATTALSSSTPGFDIPLRFGMNRSWGFSVERTTSAMFLSGVVEMSTKYVLAVVGVGTWALLYFDATLATLAVIGAVILTVGAIIVTAVLRSEHRARQVAHLLDRLARWALAKISRTAPDDLVDRIVSVRLEARSVLGKRWPAAFAAASLSQAFNYFILLFSLRAVGVESSVISWEDVLLAQGVMIILTTIPITPGNVGIAEVGYMAVFVAIAGRDEANTIAAGVLLARLVTWLMTIPIGWIMALRWQSTSGQRLLAGAAPPPD